ncbi:glucose-1-phosphate thymidylyltransferase [Thermosulfuriphilus sp.]
MLKPKAYFDLDALGRYLPLFEGIDYVWEVLSRLKAFIREAIRPNIPPGFPLGEPLGKPFIIYEGELRPLETDFEVRASGAGLKIFKGGEPLPQAGLIMAGAVFWNDQVELGPGVIVEPGALIKGPTIIGARSEVRQGAYIRGDCLVGEECVVGHTTEIKHSVMLSGAKAGHFAYIGDSILGLGVNLGAGTKLANLKMRPSTVKVVYQGEPFDTGCRKLGAILGDASQTGCNSVTNPGVFLGPGSLVLPGVVVKSGLYPPKSFLRL